MDKAAVTESAMIDIVQEYDQAVNRFGTFASSHEGYAVILEELDELWDEVKNNSSKKVMRAEAVQVAAMAWRFMVDCCYDKQEGGNNE